MLDVKVGSGAFMKTLRARARAGARRWSTSAGAPASGSRAFLTDMDQPLGRWVGNAVEVHESLEVLRGRGEPDLVELTLALGAEMLVLGGAAHDAVERGASASRASLADGSALGALSRAASSCRAARMPDATRAGSRAATCTVDGGAAATSSASTPRRSAWRRCALGAGRARKEDAIDPAPGSRLHEEGRRARRAGRAGRRFLAPRRRREVVAEVRARLRAAYALGPQPPPPRPLILEVIR